MNIPNKKLISKLETIHSIILNTQQIKLIEKVNSILSKSLTNFKIKSIFQKTKSGIYLFGPAGRGKTMIVNFLINELKIKSLKFHFNDLIFQLQKLNFSSDKKFLKELIDNKVFINNLKIIFIDELDINNIADIIILQKFLDRASFFKIFIIFTSNKPPDKLFKSNHHIETLNELNKYFLRTFHLLELKNNKDYRKNMSYPSNFIFEESKNNNKIISLRKKIVGDIKPRKKKFTRSGNSFMLEYVYEDLIECDFSYICGKNLNFKDYKLILKKINFIFLKNVPIFEESVNDQIKRFIYLIDAMYEERKILSISTLYELKNLYKKKKNIIECERTFSRLNQILSEKYIIDNLNKKSKL